MTNLMSALYDTREGVSSRSYEGAAALFMMREFRTEKVEPDLNLADLPESLDLRPAMITFVGRQMRLLNATMKPQILRP